MNIFHPRVNDRGGSNGITGTQFPSYEFGLAGIYQFTGEHYWVSRVWSLLIFSLGIIFTYWWVLNLTGNKLKACMAAWCFCWSPELFYHGINALPDILALTAALGSLATCHKFLNDRKNIWLFISMLLLMLAGLTKIQFLLAGSIWAVLLFTGYNKEKFSKSVTTVILISGLMVAGMCAAWYGYAKRMIAQSGLQDVGLDFKPETDWHAAMKTISHNIMSDIPELLMGYASFIFFIVGIYLYFTKRKKINNNKAIYYPWLFLFLIYYFVELKQMNEHNYYLLVCLPLLLLVMIAGAEYLYKRSLLIFTLLMLAQPVLSAMRIIPSRWMGQNNELPDAFLSESSRLKLQAVVPDNNLCIMANDNSGCIWFYFLHKRGFAVADKSMLREMQNNMPNIKKYIQEGAGYLYSDDPSLATDDIISVFIDKKLMQEGRIAVYRLRLTH